MLKNVFKRTLSLLLALATVISLMPQIPLEAHAADYTIGGGFTASSSGSATWIQSGSTITGSVAGKNGMFSFLNSAQNGSLTFTNGRDTNAILSFDYVIGTKTGDITIGGTKVTAGGTIETTLEPGDAYQITIKSGKGASNKTEITLNNVTMVADTSATTTFAVPGNGSYTVNGEAITTETVKTQKSTEEYNLVATPAAGYTFLGWYSTAADGYVSYATSASIKVEKDTTIYPVFSSSSQVVFRVGNKSYTDLNAANTAAQADASKQITLVQSGTLAAGTYEISSGVKLLIPYNALYTANFSTATKLTGSFVNPKMYSCLTLSEGAVINCYGKINVNAEQFSNSNTRTGETSGPYGAIHLNTGSRINMESGSGLYAYGYIGGDGMVHAKSGSEVCQLFQIADWRGGSAASSIAMGEGMKGSSFMVSQYYFQNIEATLRVDSGCTMYGAAAITANDLQQQTVATIIGKSEGMFHMTNGYAVLDYDPATDRSNLDFYGDLITDSISMSIKVIFDIGIDTANYILALPMNYSINLKSGSVSFSQKFKLMPGTEITIDKGASATINDNGALYLYDVDDWLSGKYSYGNSGLQQVRYVYANDGAPVKRTVTADSKLQVDGTLTATGPIYSTKDTEDGGDAAITGSGTVVIAKHGTTMLNELTQDGTKVSKAEITCVPAVGALAGHEGLKSFDIGTYNVENSNWYQYTLGGTGFTIDSGAKVVDGANGGQVGLIANAKDDPAQVVIEVPNASDCRIVTGMNVDENGFFPLADNEQAIALAAETMALAAEEGEPTGSSKYILSTFTGNVTIDAAPHVKGAATETPADCSNPAKTSYTCSRCGKPVEKFDEITGEALGHDYSVLVETVAPTCTTDGYTTYQCVRCDLTENRDPVPAAHTYEAVVTAPTCLEKGYTTYTCSCGETYTGDEVDALGHAYGEWETVTASTCTTKGTKKRTCTREGCEASEEGALPLAGHQYTSKVTAPTCEEKGYTTYTCSACTYSYMDDYVNAKGHTSDGGKITKTASCVEKGEKTYTCTVCRIVIETEEVEVDPARHKTTTVMPAKAPDCTTDGLTPGQQCSDCKTVITAQETVPATGHTSDGGKVTQAATCTEKGIKTYTCTVCTTVISMEGVPVDPDNHKIVDVKGTAADCTNPGLTDGTRCERCNKDIKAQTVINALGHDHVGTVTAPTCLDQGYTTYKCSRCNDEYVGDYVDAPGHDYKGVVTAPTCSEGGYTTYTCSACGDSYVDDHVASPGHSFSEWKVTTQPTCTEKGLQKRSCPKCGKEETEDVPATDHTYGEWEITPETCTKDGERVKHCINGTCDAEVRETIPATGHTYEWVVQTAATCQTEGVENGTCHCGDTTTKSLDKDPDNHQDWDEGEYLSNDDKPTCTKEGVLTYTCECGFTKTEEVKADGHDPVSDADLDPTCTLAGKEGDERCATCGVIITEGKAIEPLGHDYKDTVKKPTCQDQGYTTYTCSRCDSSYTDNYVDPVGSAHDYHTETVAPTCTAKGYDKYVCGICEHEEKKEGTEVNALGHDCTEKVKTVEPTCLEQGYDVYKCVRCEVTDNTNYQAALGHDYKHTVTDPTCTEEGYTTHTCSVCDDSYVDTKVASKGHSYGDWVTTTEPTCTEKGEKAQTCDSCGNVVEEPVDETGHTYDAGKVTAPTCDKGGYTTYTCHCGETKQDDATPALGHSYGEWNITKAATCIAEGAKERTCVNGCGKKETAVVGMTGHAYKATVTDPTCLEKGYTTHTCTTKGCGDTYKDTYTNALGHRYGEWEVTKDPTCLNPGEKVKTCVCGDKVKEAVPATGHQYGDGKVTDPTCLEQGYTTYTCTAKNCGYSYKDTYTDALGHEFGEWTEIKAPTCIAEGEKKHTCTRTGCNFFETEPVEKAAHIYEDTITPPTCLDKGYTTYTCTTEGCTDSYVDVDSYVDALGHVFGEWEETLPPTCIAEGEQKRTCTNEGCAVFETSILDMVAHTYEPTITDPTCTEQGYTTYACTTEGCTDSYVDVKSYVAATGHDFSVEKKVNKEATCEEQGSRTMSCANEGCKETQDEVIPARGHDYHDTITPPTCTEVGNLHTQCSRCGDSSDSELPVNGHVAELLPGKAPTCTETGLTEGYKCTVCGDVYQPQEELPAAGHDYDEGVVNEQSTCLVQGSKTLHCQVCGHDEVVVLPLADHTYVIDEAVAATCLEDGLTQGRHCSVEGCTYVEAQEVIPATGHTVVPSEKQEPSCVNPGREEGTVCSVCGEILTGDEIPVLPHDAGTNPWTVIKPASCSEVGTETSQCAFCKAEITREIEKLPHITEVIPAVEPRYDADGSTEGSKCSVCGEIVVKPEKIDKLVLDWEGFLISLQQLEVYAREYAASNPGKDPTKLVINFIRTGVDRYNDDSWETMAGPAETVFINEVLAKDDINGSHAYALREMDYVAITLPNGQELAFDHMFGAMNVSSKNNYTLTNTDFGSWVGDLCDLMQYANRKGFVESEDMEAMVAEITEKYFRADDDIESGFGIDDVRADLDNFYMVNQILAGETSLSKNFESYYTSSLSDRSRAAYFLNNRFPGKLTQEEVRTAVYTTYKDHILAQLLEADRDLSQKHKLREAACYTFADYLYNLAKNDLVAPEPPEEEDKDDPNHPDVYSVFSSSTSTLAPGITQTINYGLDSNGDQIVFYIAEADINREDVSIYANYNNNDPTSWAMSTVSSQMKAAEKKHTNPDDPANYIPNYAAIVGTNASFYNMSTGEPTGLFVMEGKTYKTGGYFFAVLKDGTAIIGGNEEYNLYKDQIQEAVGGSTLLVKDGKNLFASNNTDKAPRTVVGITAEGKVILVVLDGRQKPFSAGASMYEMAQILVDLGCVSGLNLDGGGSSTFDAKQEGSDKITLVNRPCDTYERSVSTSILVVSTANVSKEFDHAVLTTETDYLTVNSSMDVVVTGVGAAGNQAPIPEDAYLTVSNASVGKIEEGRFVALARGTVDIQLMAGDQVVGSKTVEVIRRPDALKFTETSLNAIYGIAEPLPLVATYKNANVTINADDVVWELSNELAGTVENFAFTGIESSGVRNVMVTAKVKTNVNITANMGLRLYSENESIFDFDDVTAGNESLAWNRVMTNAVTADGKNYFAEDPDKNMVADYTFALDMKAIKAPARLQPLMEYLNGFAGNVGDNATPWDYLLALGARVSSLTNVVIRAEFPEGVSVDYSELNFVNDFMVLKNADFDEEKRVLTIELSWIRQTDGIDPSTANSIGILSGLKLTQEDKTQIKQTVGITGNVTYDIYMDTSQLHSFAKDPENQIKYGIKDYINPDDPGDAGGHFMDTYITFEDHFNMNREKLNGWVTLGTDGMHYYYVDNEMVTGIRYVEDMEGSGKMFFYNFGEDGISTGKVTGKIELDGKLYYALNGERKTGWQTLNTPSGELGYYYFDVDGAAVDGEQIISGYHFRFEDKVLVRGEIVTEPDGRMHYRWANIWLMRQWVEDGDKKYFPVYDPVGYGYFAKGLVSARKYGEASGYVYCLFGDDYVWQEDFNGLYTNPSNGKIYLIKNGVRVDYAGLVKFGNDYYYFNDTNSAVQGKNVWVSKTNGLLPEGMYTTGMDGKIIFPEPEKKNGIVEEEGALWYYVDGVRKYAGLIEIDGDYYYVKSNGQVVQNRSYWVTRTNDLVPEGSYTFGADGKMVNPPVVKPTEPEVTDPKPTEPEVTDPKPTEPEVTDPKPTEPEVTDPKPTEPEVTDPKPTEPEVTDPKPTEPEATEPDPSVKSGIVAEDGGLWYYENGFRKYMGLIELDGDYYYVRSNGQLAQNRRYWVTRTNDLLPEAMYTFDAEGKMVDPPVVKPTEPKPTEPEVTDPKPTEPEVTDPKPTEPEVTDPKPTEPEVTDPKPTEPVKNGIVEENGSLWYYENGVRKYKGLMELDGAYYYVRSNGQLTQNRRYWVTRTNGLMSEGNYTFDAEGKMVDPPVVKPTEPKPTEPEVTDPKPTEPEVTDPKPTEPEVTDPKPTEPEVTDPKPTDPSVKNGIVAEDNGLWYYENGLRVYKGLIQIDGDYYYVRSNGQLVQNRRYWITRTNDLLDEASYRFDGDGKLVF